MTAAVLPLPSPPPAAHLIVFRGANPEYVAVFVEGPDDVETWKPWLKWRPFPAGGCGPVLAAVASLRAIGESGYVGILDADCARLEGRDHSAADVIVTEHHDLECDLLQLPALEKLLGVVEDGLVATLSGPKSFRDAVVERALPFGLLRWHFFRRGTEYQHGRLSPHHFIDKHTWVLDEELLLREASEVLVQSVADLKREVITLRKRASSPWNICNGHDLLCVLAIAFRGPLAAAKQFPQSTALSTSLRLAVDARDLDSLSVWRALRAWETANQPWVACRR